jgi:hypothetical protein
VDVSGFEQVKLRALAIHARHVADARQSPARARSAADFDGALIEARNLNLLRGAQL